MAQDKNSIVFYRDWKEIFENLNDKDCAELVRHIFRYVNDENPTTDNQLVNAHFLHIRNCLKRDLKKWEAQRAKKVEAGRIGGKHTQAKRSTAKQSQANQAVSVSVNGSVNVNGNVSERDNTHALGKINDNFFLVIPKEIGLSKYRVNGTEGLLELVGTIGGVLPLYTPELGYKFMRNNKGKVFNEIAHVWNTWNQFLKQTA